MRFFQPGPPRRRPRTARHAFDRRNRSEPAAHAFFPPPCRIGRLGSLGTSPKLIPEEWQPPGFWHRLIRFRHVISGSLSSSDPASRAPGFGPRGLARFWITATTGLPFPFPSKLAQSRSMRAAITAWTVAGTWMAGKGRARW